MLCFDYRMKSLTGRLPAPRTDTKSGVFGGSEHAFRAPPLTLKSLPPRTDYATDHYWLRGCVRLRRTLADRFASELRGFAHPDRLRRLDPDRDAQARAETERDRCGLYQPSAWRSFRGAVLAPH